MRLEIGKIIQEIQFRSSFGVLSNNAEAKKRVNVILKDLQEDAESMSGRVECTDKRLGTWEKYWKMSSVAQKFGYGRQDDPSNSKK